MSNFKRMVIPRLDKVEARITSFPLSSKGFTIESSPTSNKKRSYTLNVALISYSHGNFESARMNFFLSFLIF